MTLFSANRLKAKVRPPGLDARPRRRIPTGAPRLVESSRDRSTRAPVDAWEALLDEVRRSASARLALLTGRAPGDQIACPWARITGCDASCRCRGTETVTVGFLRGHYQNLAAKLDGAVMPKRTDLSRG